jgi:nucleoside-diphosphate-sugar epimerase
MADKILVIGATGTIGSTVCELLKAENADFTALVRNDDKAKSFVSKAIKTVTGDLADMDSLRKAMHGIVKLFLLSVTSPDLPKLQGNAAKIAKEQGIKHIVKISVRGAGVDADFNIGRNWEFLIPFSNLIPSFKTFFLTGSQFWNKMLFFLQWVKEKSRWLIRGILLPLP